MPSQYEILKTIPVEHIPHGTRIDANLVRRFYPNGGFILDLGCGTGHQQVCDFVLGYGYIGLDINSAAIEAARTRGFSAYTADARYFYIPEVGRGVVPLLLENFNAVMMQGLLSNMYTGRDIRWVVRSADMWLRPSGLIFVSDVLHADEHNPLLSELPGFDLEAWRNVWLGRYRVNATVNRKLGIPVGLFAIAPPGDEKDQLDHVADPEELERLIQEGKFERFARHVRISAIESYFRRLHFVPVHFEYTVWWSRNGQPLSGGVWVFQKGNRFRYHPWCKGMTHYERLVYAEEVHIRRMTEGREYTSRFWKQFFKNIPPFQKNLWQKFLSENP